MVKGPAVGYIYGIKDPYTDLYIYVGNSPYPWEAVKRHLDHSSNPELREWAERLKLKHPEGIQILGREVCDKWYDASVELPARNNKFRVEWSIFGVETETFEAPGDIRTVPRIKPKIINDLLDRGHPLINRPVGRRLGSKNKPRETTED